MTKKKKRVNQNAMEKMASRKTTWHRIKNDRYQYLMLLPAILVTIIFCYIPMRGVVMAFQDYDIFKGILGSKWVGFQQFEKIFTQRKFLQAVSNTLLISTLNLLLCFPAPIILALLINELKNGIFKKGVQTISYLPHFLSWTSVVGLVYILFGADGIINETLVRLGKESVGFLTSNSTLVALIIGSMLWKETGWGTIIHLANITSINPELYEAASIDGATRLQKTRFITLPHMIPTVIILLIFQMGSLFSSNFDLIYGLQNPYLNFEVISTLVYQTGIQGGDYSLSTALGFAQGMVALILVLSSNALSKKFNSTGIV